LFVFLAPPNAPSLSARLTAIIDHLCQAAAARLAATARLRVRQPAGEASAGRPKTLSGPLLILLWTRLQALSRRLAALAAWAAAGRALTRRRGLNVAPRAPTRRPPPAPFPRLPHKFAWLVRLVPEAACYGSQLRHLLAEPEMAALLAASPQARRLVRPLCRMLAVPPPAVPGAPPPDPPDPPLSDAAAAPPRSPPPTARWDAGWPTARARPAPQARFLHA